MGKGGSDFNVCSMSIKCDVGDICKLHIKQGTKILIWCLLSIRVTQTTGEPYFYSTMVLHILLSAEFRWNWLGIMPTFKYQNHITKIL